MLSPAKNNRLLTTDDLLAFLPISRPTLSRLAKAGTLPHLRVGGRLFFRPSAIARFLSEREIGSEARGRR